MTWLIYGDQKVTLRLHSRLLLNKTIFTLMFLDISRKMDFCLQNRAINSLSRHVRPYGSNVIHNHTLPCQRPSPVLHECILVFINMYGA